MDPLDPRRAGTRRLRLATAAIAGGALVGTGALTVVVAQAHPASAAGTTDAATGGASSGSSSESSSEQGPGRPGGFGHGSGGAHGSSGAS